MEQALAIKTEESVTLESSRVAPVVWVDGVPCYPGAPLEYYSDKVMALIVREWGLTPDTPMMIKELRDYIAGIYAAVMFLETFSQWQVGAEEDLSFLEEFLTIKGDCNAHY